VPDFTHSPYGPLVDTTLRVATWNLWWRFGPWEERRAGILAALRDLDADVVGLQEVWGEGQANLARLLGDELGYHVEYGARLDLGGVLMGNAVLCRWPITSSEQRELPAIPGKDEMRGILRADVDGPRGPFQVFTTHLNYRFDQSAIRQDQVRELCRFVQESRPREYPPIVTGDFNADPHSDEMRMLTGQAATPEEALVFHDAWRAAGDGPGYTWRNENPFAAIDLEPDRRIDYVLVGWPREGGRGNVVSAEVFGTEAVEGVHPSDHAGVVAELRY